MTRRGNTAAAGLLLALGAGASGPGAAFTINFDFSFDANNFFGINSNAVTVLEAAADFFESTITDDLLAIDSAGGNNFTARFFDPSDPFGPQESISQFDVAADTITVFVGGFQFSGGTLGLGGPGGFSLSGSPTFVDNAITRGETPTQGGVSGIGATDFAPWGGSISFNSDTNWYFDTDPSTDESFAGQQDFYSVALHELGHVLGFGTSDSWDNQISGGQFTGSNAVAVNGGAVNLSGDGAHWAGGTNSTIFGSATPQEAAMDPSIAVGRRKRFTDLDMAGLEDIGWEVAAASAQ